jgi:hypothetical protein
MVFVHEAVRLGWLCILDCGSYETQRQKSSFESVLFGGERETVAGGCGEASSGVYWKNEVIRFVVAMSVFANGMYYAI